MFTTRLLVGSLVLAGLLPKLSADSSIQDLRRANLLANPGFAAGPQGKGVRSWSFYPADSPQIRRTTTPGEVEMTSGAMNAALGSRKIPVEAEKAYTLVFDLKQENIHIGFGMGAQAVVSWNLEDGSRRPEILGTIDGSFDWEQISYSVTAPPSAQFATVRLAKKGSPGRIFFRNPIFAPGVLVKSLQDYTESEFLKDIAAFEFFQTRLADLMADKESLEISELSDEQKKVHDRSAAAAASVRSDAKKMGITLEEDQRDLIIWKEMLKGVLGFRISPASPYYSDWQALDEEFLQFEEHVSQWLGKNNRNRLAEKMKEKFEVYEGYALGVDSTMLKVRRDEPYTGEVRGQARLAQTRNEEEGVQITLTALDRPLNDVQLEVTSLKDPEGNQIPVGQVRIHRIDFVKTNPPAYYAGSVGWWPDVVFPTSKVDLVPQGQNKSFWVTVETTAETKEGNYQGEIVVKEGDKVLQSLPLHVKVWDVTLPRPGKFEVIGCFHPYMLRDFYRWDEMKDEVVADWDRFIIHKRWNPTLYFSKSITPSGEALKASVEEGLNAINLLDPSKFLDRDESRTYSWPDEEQEKALTVALRKARQDFRDAGGSEATKLYVSGFDEQHDRAQYKLMRHVFDLAKKVVPEAKVLTTTTYPPLEDLAGSVDTWVPLLGKSSEDLQKRQAAGDELHFYVYAHPYRPYPNPSLVDYPGIDSRITFWLAARMGYTGFLHYLFNGWKPNIDKEGPRWPESRWIPYANEGQKSRNGAGYFLYPGPGEQPVASVRMELVRDGIEDWEMITLLKEAITEAEKSGNETPALAGARDALKRGMEMVPALDHVSNNMEELLGARTDIAHALISLQNTLQPNED